MSYKEPHNPASSEPKWWDVIKAVADLARGGCEIEEWDEDEIYEILRDFGFSKIDIESGLDWLTRISGSMSTEDILTMVETDKLPIRVSDMCEVRSLDPQVLRRVNILRDRGILPESVAEKVLETLRELDTDEWDAQDTDEFFTDLLTHLKPTASDTFIKNAVGAKKKIVLH